MSRERGCWLYSLMSRLLKPLPGEVASAMRQLYRTCCRMRLHLVEAFIARRDDSQLRSGGKSGPLEQHGRQEADDQTHDEAEEEFDRKLAIINTMIVITGLYFGQGEDFAKLSET
jgi:hypothetical protein